MAQNNRKLTAKQQAFVNEYLIDLNATQAAIRAGYSQRNADKIGSELLGKTRVAAAVHQAMAARADRTKISADRVLLEYARLAFSDMASFMQWGPNGATVKVSDDLSADDSACVSEVVYTWDEDGGRIRFKLHDKKGALDSVARHLGLFEKDNQQATEAFMRFLLAEQPLPTPEAWEQEFSQYVNHGLDTPPQTNGHAALSSD